MAEFLENEAMKGVDDKRKSSIFARTLSSIERVEGFKIPARTSKRRAYGDVHDEE